MSVYKGGQKDEVFKNNYKNILSTLLVLTIFIISGAIFNVFRIWFIWIKSNP